MTAGFEVPDRAEGAAETSGNSFRQDPFILETRGWSALATDCEPKLFAIASLANLGTPDPVASVSYRSQGNVLVIAGASAERARRCAHELAADLHVTLLDHEFVAAPAVTSWRGEVRSLSGFLGEFTAEVALDGAAARPAKFDLVLDFSSPPLFPMRQPPQGYRAAPADDGSLAQVLDELREAVGEFEKPRFFAYRENICAHSRSQVAGCSRCIDICSTQAIASDGDHVSVDPHLCMGCGACATVCPSGAMSYQYPRVADRGAQMKQLLSSYRKAGGADACIVFHDGNAGRALLESAAASGQGLPARALPLEAWHSASIGLDLLLPAIAFGASHVVVIAGDADREYVHALREQMAIGQSILGGLGYAGTHFAVVEARDGLSLEAAFGALEPTGVPPVTGTFMLGNDKRTAIEFAVEHLARHAPAPATEIALPAGAPFGEVRVDRDKCTMCMACVGSCPESALMDGVDQPLLKFLERNCVQCGLCESTCPENAITLSPRLLLTPQVREARVVNQTEPFHCVSCGKAFGTRQIVQSMLGRLAGHSMFAGEGALRRLQMCGDCRVVDMMASKSEVSVLKLGADS
ncbi:MAG TPA: 4Fe-4S binding protein [Usitatibacter sp.]|nr:4Fe-4S binding protein [Usitatibacter sp.]